MILVISAGGRLIKQFHLPPKDPPGGLIAAHQCVEPLARRLTNGPCLSPELHRLSYAFTSTNPLPKRPFSACFSRARSSLSR